MDPHVLHAIEEGYTGYRVKTLDIVSDLLGEQKSPGAFGDGLCRRIQNLTGARGLCLLQCRGGKEAPKPVSAYPARLSGILQNVHLDALVDLSPGHAPARLYRTVSSDSELSTKCSPAVSLLLRRLEFDSALTVPLQVGSSESWLLILFGVPCSPQQSERADGDGLIAAMELLSTLLGLVLRFGPFLDPKIDELTQDTTANAALHPAASLSSSSPVGIFRLNAVGDLVYADDRFLAFHGFPEKASVGPQWLDAMHSQDRETVRAEWRLAVAQKRGSSLTYRVRDRYGNGLWLSLLTAPELDRLGLVSGYVGMVSDTTLLNGNGCDWSTDDGSLCVADAGRDKDDGDYSRIAELQSIQDSFCESLGVNGIITGPDGARVTRPYCQDDFCGLVRSSARGRLICKLSDGVERRTGAGSGPEVGAGCLACEIIDGSAPIMADKRMLANWIIGRSRLPDVGEEELHELAGRLGIDPHEMIRAYKETPRLSDDAFGRVFKIQQQMAREFVSAEKFSSGQTTELADLVKREEDRRRGEQSYHTLFNAMLDGFAMHDVICDEEGVPVDYRFLDVNPAFEKIFGKRRGELVGRSALEVFPQTEAFWIDTFGRVALDGKSVKFEQYATAIDRHIEVFAYQVETGKFAAVIRDITERKQDEKRSLKLNELLEERVYNRTRELEKANGALLESDRRYRRLIESLREGYFFYSLDPDGNMEYLSDSVQSILGYTRQEYGAGRYLYLTDNPVNEIVEGRTEAGLRGTSQPPYEVEMRCKDGSIRTLEVLEVPVKNERDQVISVEGIAHDITEQKRNREMIQEAQSQLMEKEKLAALGSLVAGVAHEISTPIGIGVTATSLLVEHARHCEKLYRSGELKRSDFEKFLVSACEAAEMIESNLERGVELIKSFKLVAVDQSSEEKRSFRLKEYLEGILHSLRPQLKGPGHEVVLNCPEKLEMDGFPGAMSQVLTNLVLNSTTHGFAGREGGTITIDAARRKDMLRLRYNDNGRGMEPEVRRKVFEPFFTTRRGKGGSGLGMHITYNLVTQTMKGSISCSSSSDKGTTFIIMIPMEEDSRE